MSENLNRGARDFSKYDTMATADLEEILRLDAESPEGTESDTELLIYVMGVLADRRRNNGNAGKTAFEAWESFEKNYIPEEEESTVRAQKHTAILLTPWVRRIAAAAAIVLILIGLPHTAKAFGLGDLWDVFARWAKETFSFVSGDGDDFSEPTPDSQEEFTSLQDALKKSNRDSSIVPTWVPEGYLLGQIIKDVSPIRESYIAYYYKDSNVLQVFVQSFLTTDVKNNEISSGPHEKYTHDGIDYFIISNNEQNKAVWITDSFECSITGNVTVEEIKMMIDSIGKE